MEASAPRVWSADLTAPHEMAALQRDANLEYMSLAPPPYAARLTITELGPLHVQDASDQAHIVRGTIAPNRTILLFGIGRIGSGVKVNGHAMSMEDAILFSPGAEILSVLPGPQDWGGVAVEQDSFDRLMEGAHRLPDQGFVVARGAMARATPLRAISTRVSAIARQDPARLGQGTVLQSLIETLNAALADTLHRDVYTRDLRPGRALRRRVQLVSAAADLMREAIATPLYTEDLCLACFWHLGRFAQQYRALFGESPSATLAAALGQRRASRGTSNARLPMPS